MRPFTAAPSAYLPYPTILRTALPNADISEAQPSHIPIIGRYLSSNVLAATQNYSAMQNQPESIQEPENKRQIITRPALVTSPNNVVSHFTDALCHANLNFTRMLSLSLHGTTCAVTSWSASITSSTNSKLPTDASSKSETGTLATNSNDSRMRTCIGRLPKNTESFKILISALLQIMPAFRSRL
jgi:hypothetical protein